MLKRTLKLALLTLSFLAACVVNAGTVDQLLRNKQDPVGGNPDGKVTVVEFFDYECSHCDAMGPVIEAAMHANPNVRFVFKEYPMRGPMSLFASRAALAANLQGKYAAMHFALLSANQPYSERSIYAIANSAGVNVGTLKKDMGNSNIQALINENRTLGKTLKILGTPAFFIGKTDATSLNQVKFVLGEMNVSQLNATIKKFQ